MKAATANRLKASAEISSIAIRDCTNSIWLQRRDEARGNRRPLRCEQRQSAEIDRDDRERAEQGARIAPAQRVVTERVDRQRDHLFRQRRMHRVEHWLSRDLLQHLPRRRHVMHLVKIEFLGRGHADQHREMRREKQDHRDQAGVSRRNRGNRR